MSLSQKQPKQRKIANMPTTHETLFTLKQEVRKAKADSENGDLEFYDSQVTPFTNRLEETDKVVADYKKLRREYMKSFYTVLEDSHGVKRSAIIAKGKPTKKNHQFMILLGGRLLIMHAISTGQKITFFLQGAALEDNEKIEVRGENNRFPHVA